MNIAIVFYHTVLHCKYIGVCSVMAAGGRRNMWMESRNHISMYTAYAVKKIYNYYFVVLVRLTIIGTEIF